MGERAACFIVAVSGAKCRCLDNKKPTLGSALSASGRNQNSAVRGVRGKGITSRTLPMPVT